MKKMMKKACLYLLFFSFFHHTGCYSAKVVSQDIFHSENNTEPTGDITIFTNKDDIIEIEENSYQVLNDTLFAKGLLKTNVNNYGQPIDVKISIEDIQYIKIEEFDGLATAGCILGVGALVFLVVVGIVIANSGPWFEWPDEITIN